MRHITIKQATEGDTGYYEVEVDFDGRIERAGKRHLDYMLCMLNWVFKGEFTYTVLLAEIPANQRLRCTDQTWDGPCDSIREKAVEIRQRSER